MSNFLVKKSADTFAPEFGLGTIQTTWGETACQVTDFSADRESDNEEMLNSTGELRQLIMRNPRTVAKITVILPATELAVLGDEPDNTATSGEHPTASLGQTIYIPGLAVKGSITKVGHKYTRDGYATCEIEATRWDSIGDPTVSVLS